MNKSRLLMLVALGVILLVSSVGVFAGSVAGGHETPNQSAEYNITHNVSSNQTVVTVAFTVTADEKYDIWNGRWSVPEDAEIVSASSAHSESVELERNGTQVRLKERDGDAREYETFYLTYKTDSLFTVREYGGITQYEGSLSAYRNHSSEVRVEFVNHEVANAVRYSNHSIVSHTSAVSLTGTGPIGFVVNVKDDASRKETDDFVVYGGNVSTDVLNNSYALSTIGTGVIPQYKQVPVLVIAENEYDVQFGNGSAGRYHRGVVFVSENEVAERGDALVLLTHEYTHAVTARVQGGSGTPRWFTEGASQYTESMAREYVGKQQVLIDEEQFTEYESADKSWVVTSWESQVNESNVHFAYSYSELLFKSVERDDAGSIRTLYANMVTDEVQVNENTTPRVLFGDSWNGTACDASIECADETLQFVPNSSAPESYMLAISGYRTNVSDGDSVTQTPTETPIPTTTETETKTETETEVNNSTPTVTEEPDGEQTPTENESTVQSKESESDGGLWSFIQSLIDAVFSFLDSLFGFVESAV